MASLPSTRAGRLPTGRVDDVVDVRVAPLAAVRQAEPAAVAGRAAEVDRQERETLLDEELAERLEVAEGLREGPPCDVNDGRYSPSPALPVATGGRRGSWGCQAVAGPDHEALGRRRSLRTGTAAGSERVRRRGRPPGVPSATGTGEDPEVLRVALGRADGEDRSSRQAASRRRARPRRMGPIRDHRARLGRSRPGAACAAGPGPATDRRRGSEGCDDQVGEARREAPRGRSSLPSGDGRAAMPKPFQVVAVVDGAGREGRPGTFSRSARGRPGTSHRGPMATSSPLPSGSQRGLVSHAPAPATIRSSPPSHVDDRSPAWW